MWLCYYLIVFAGFASFANAETGIQGWLRYAPLPSLNISFQDLPGNIIALNDSRFSPVYTAGQEVRLGLKSIFGKSVDVRHQNLGNNSGSVTVGTVQEFERSGGILLQTPVLQDDGFWLSVQGNTVLILGNTERGALYGTFEYLSMLAQGNFSDVAYATSPNGQIRWVNQWDNLDGSIERGFAGPSIFFANGTVLRDLTRASDYARLLASIRLNAVVVNNVNANSSVLRDENIEGLGRIADVFRPYGIQLGISLDFASPMDFGNLSTYDPLDPSVIEWWDNKTAQIYQNIPDMAGYLVKADSEGEPGPLVYNRTLSQGANLFAAALKPYGGIVMFRAFVYNLLNESIWTADRAKAAVQFFQPLDGQFEDNVVIQIKYGPIDFQVREPTSPLFANLFHTNTAIELEVTQEYLGQQCHVVYLPPLWQTVLGFDLRIQNQTSLVRDIISGQRFNRPLGGSAGVVNVGTNQTWLGSHLSMSNLYAYGMLAWNPQLESIDLLQAWTRLTFGLDPIVMSAITSISMESWPAYENYTGNLGEQTLTDILYTHFGPNPQSADDNGYCQWTRADHATIGMDRTCSNGTCFSGQYPSEIHSMYENIDTTPDDLLLWFHHVNYTQPLSTGETVIQHFYNAHYAGAETAQTFPTQWLALKGKIDDQRYEEQLFRLRYQAGHSLVWRDSIVNFYNNLSGIPDDLGRVGKHPYRIEAEAMDLDGYVPYTVSPFEAASNHTAIVTSFNNSMGTARVILNRTCIQCNIAVNYYDLYGGVSIWSLYLNETMVGEWFGNAEDILGHTPSIYIDGHSAMRITFENVTVNEGDVLTLTGQADGVEPAPADYISILPRGIVD